MSPRSLSLGVSALLGVVAAVAVGCAKSDDVAPNVINCTPGAYVYCRCQDRTEGTKLCKEDGHSYEACDPCESPENPQIPDDPKDPPEEVDAGKDAADASPPVSASCGDRVAQDGEDCDDGNTNDDDGCDATCHLAGLDPSASRSCPGMDVHVWGKAVTYAGTTQGSTNTGSASPTCSGTGGANPTTGAAASDRVFRVTAHKTGTMKVATTDASYDSFLYVTQKCTPGAQGQLSYLACMNGQNGTAGETMTFPVTAGQVYSVLVDGAGISGQNGTFRVTFSIP